MIYSIGKKYVDKGNPKFEEDQFMRWINIPGVTGMMNSPGIRWLNYKERKPLPAILILITKTVSSSYHNPWDDIIDVNSGQIYYWGDAKAGKKECEEFLGNKILKKIYDEILKGNLKEVPPILHFSKPRRGEIIFNGLCIMKKLELTWFEDNGIPVRNYRANLQILDVPSINVSWIHKRVMGDFSEEPNAWKDYISGKKPPYFKIWNKRILSKKDQIPEKNTIEYDVLNQIHRLSPCQFEHFTVELIERIEGITHSITNTKYVRDKGFDFYGYFKLPYPLGYVIRFKGEAKKYQPDAAVGPKDVSRLVSKLGRGEYGIFVTTSYYSTQAQEEIYEDDYPIKLICGNDLINFLREFKLLQSGKINNEWLNKIIDNV